MRPKKRMPKKEDLESSGDGPREFIRKKYYISNF
jgi:hypothetical protein